MARSDCRVLLVTRAFSGCQQGRKHRQQPHRPCRTVAAVRCLAFLLSMVVVLPVASRTCGLQHDSSVPLRWPSSWEAGGVVDKAQKKMRTQGNHELGTHFFDYRHDEEALFQEDQVAQALVTRGCLFEDPAFPASAESLYRTPQQPPSGTLPAALAVWGRITQQEVRRCHTPVTFPADGALAWVVEGALGDSWLVSALNMLAPFPDVLKKVVISDKRSDKGMYTLKLFKEGAWRYLHVDDRLPCSPSRVPHYCLCKDPNQVWAPLIEKAFAKLHGCYESLGRGSIEAGLRCLTGAPVLRTPLMGIPAKKESDATAEGGAGSDKPSEKRWLELWAKMKKWQKRGCVMGCYRSVELARARNRQTNSNTSRVGPAGGGGRRQTGLMAARGYGIRRVCEASAGATYTRDAVVFKLVELSCPWGLGRWRGDWSKNSGLWEKYPSVKAELLGLRHWRASSGEHPATAGGGGDDEDGGDDAEQGIIAAATPVEASRSVRQGEEEESSFWMSFDDFTAEFSQLLTCVLYSDGQDSNGISRKSYRGRWIPGDPLTGSGGGCASPAFLQNPFYPVTIQRNSTTLTVCLSVWDRTWQADPSRGGPAIGYYIVRLNTYFPLDAACGVLEQTGSKPRLTKLRSGKIAARSVAFMMEAQSAGQHTVDSGRYAIVPVTVKPLNSAEEFVLDLTANNTVEWEQTDDRIQDLDQVLRLSDEEGDSSNTAGAATTAAASGKHPGVVSVLSEETIETEDFDGPPGNKVAEALHEQIAELSSLISDLEAKNIHQGADDGDGASGSGIGLDDHQLQQALPLGRDCGTKDEDHVAAPPYSGSPLAARK